MRLDFRKLIVRTSMVGTAVGCIFIVKSGLVGSSYKGMPNIAGTTVIVTGANTGLGFETAKALAIRGGKVIMACRDMEKCEKARKVIMEESCNKCVECVHLDLASLKSVRECAKKINEEQSHVEVLINNAGVMGCPKQTTEDGIEMQLGVNHFGHFLFTYLLLDKLKASAPSRVITLSSIAHRIGKINFDDLNSDKKYNANDAYNQSKLANILFTKELAHRLEGSGVIANAVHPGVVDTELNRHMSLTQSRISSFLLRPFTWFILKSPAQGVMTTLYAALDPDAGVVSGKYFSNCKISEPSERAKDMEAAKRLWAISEVWTGLKTVEDQTTTEETTPDQIQSDKNTSV